MTTDIHCPYCGAETEVEVPAPEAKRAIRSTCTSCRRPIAVYSSQARAMRHTDRSVQAVAVEPYDFSDVPYYLEFVENQFAHPQKLRIPLGSSRVGRYNAHSTAELQLFTNDPSMDRIHCQLQLKDDGTLLIRDADSAIGTYVNTSLLAPKNSQRLRDGDIITMGATTAIVHMPPDDEDDLLW